MENQPKKQSLKFWLMLFCIVELTAIALSIKKHFNSAVESQQHRDSIEAQYQADTAIYEEMIREREADSSLDNHSEIPDTPAKKAGSIDKIKKPGLKDTDSLATGHLWPWSFQPDSLSLSVTEQAVYFNTPKGDCIVGEENGKVFITPGFSFEVHKVSQVVVVKYLDTVVMIIQTFAFDKDLKTI